MAFDFRFFANALQQAGQTFANMYSADWQRQRELEDQIKTMTLQRRWNNLDWEHRRHKEFEDQKELAYLEQQLQIEKEDLTRQKEASFNQFLKSSTLQENWKRAMATPAIMSGPGGIVSGFGEKMKVIAQLVTAQKAIEGKPLEAKDNEILDTLDPAARDTVAKIMRENFDRDLDHKVKDAQVQYYIAEKNYLEDRPTPGELTPAMMDDLHMRHVTILGKIAELEQSQIWQHAEIIKGKVFAAFANRVKDPDEMDAMFRQLMGDQYGTYRTLEGTISGYKGAAKWLEDTLRKHGAMPEETTDPIQKLFPPKPQPAKEMTGLLGAPKAVYGEAIGKAAKSIGSFAKGVGETIVGSVVGPKATAAIGEDRIKEIAGLPKDARVIEVLDSDEFLRLKKEGKVQVGDYVWKDGYLVQVYKVKDALQYREIGDFEY